VARLPSEGDQAAVIVNALVRLGDVALHIGANWGLFSWALARQAGSGGHVHVFEPNPQHAASLERIGAGRSNVGVHAVALSDGSGEAVLHILMRTDYEASLETHQDSGPTHQVTVPVRRLDDVVSEGCRVSFVEGDEPALLRGAARVLAPRPALLIEIEQRHRGDKIATTFQQFERSATRVTRYGTTVWCPSTA
jgi:FkbM family methyltransferase